MSKFKRWTVVHVHDGSPADGGIFIHKKPAEDMAAKTPKKLKVIQVEIAAVIPAAKPTTL